MCAQIIINNCKLRRNDVRHPGVKGGGAQWMKISIESNYKRPDRQKYIELEQGYHVD